jgi:hypothetical protein
MNRTWQLKKDRRDGAVAFLQQTIINADVRSAVLKDRRAARRLFSKIGKIDLPEDVEVICVGPSTQERDRLIVFVLPPDGTSPDHLDPFKYWIGTWYPYQLDPASAAVHGQRHCELAAAD